MTYVDINNNVKQVFWNGMAHHMDTENGTNWSSENLKEQNANIIGSEFRDYTEFATWNSGGSVSSSNNHVGMVTSIPSVFNQGIRSSNERFKGVDKSAGEDLTARDGASISWHVYKDNKKTKLPEYIQEVTDESTLNKYGLSKKDLINKETGFKSAVYINTITGEVTYGYAGTDGLDVNDIKTNLLQGIGLTPDAYRQGVNNAIKFDKATKKLGVRASVTGHSLGGGEAAAASEKTGLEAKTYNAAGVHPFTVINGKGTRAIDNYYMKHDPLTIIQNNKLILPDASGRQHQLNPKKNSSTLQNIKDGHLIETINESLNLKDEK